MSRVMWPLLVHIKNPSHDSHALWHPPCGVLVVSHASCHVLWVTRHASHDSDFFVCATRGHVTRNQNLSHDSHALWLTPCGVFGHVMWLVRANSWIRLICTRIYMRMSHSCHGTNLCMNWSSHKDESCYIANSCQFTWNDPFSWLIRAWIQGVINMIHVMWLVRTDLDDMDHSHDSFAHELAEWRDSCWWWHDSWIIYVYKWLTNHDSSTDSWLMTHLFSYKWLIYMTHLYSYKWLMTHDSFILMKMTHDSWIIYVYK